MHVESTVHVHVYIQGEEKPENEARAMHIPCRALLQMYI